MSRTKTELKRLRYAVVFLIVVVTGLALLSINQRATTGGIPDLATAIVEVRDVKKIVSVDGNLEGIRSRDIYLPTNAEILEIDVEVGDRVKKSTVLAKYEYNTGLSSSEETVKPAFRGVVTAVNYFEGDSVSPGLHAFTIVDDATYVIEVQVNENDVVDVMPDQEAKLVFPAISLDDEYDGTVKSVDPAPPTIQGVINYRTILTPEDLPDGIKIGMSVSADIIADQVEDVLAIPESFLIERDDALFVKRITWLDTEKTDYELIEVEVEIGLRTDEFVEIDSGLRLGDELVEPSFTQTRGFGLFS